MEFIKYLVVCIGYTLSFGLNGQNLTVGKHHYAWGEELSFDLVLPVEDSSSYVYVVLVDPYDWEVADFQVELISSIVHQGFFQLKTELNRSSPFILAAITESGIPLGYRTIFVTQNKDREVFNYLLSSLSSTVKLNQAFDLPDVDHFTVQAKSSETKVHSWDELNLYLQNHAKEFKRIRFLRDGTAQTQLVIPPASSLVAEQPIDTEFWFRNNSQEMANYQLSWRAIALIDFSLPPGDSIQIDASSFPVGKLAIADSKGALEIRNPPQIASYPHKKKSIKMGEAMTFQFPALINPIINRQELFIQASISRQESPYGGDFQLERFEPSPDLAFAKIWVEPESELDQKEDFHGFVIMDSTNQFAIPLADGNTSFLSHQTIYNLSRMEGRVRFARMDKKLQVKVGYPELELLGHALIEGLKSDVNALRWFFSDSPNLESFQRPFAQWELLDLDEVVINADSIEQLEASMQLHPFSEHWINTDWLCDYNVLNCEDHGIKNGNQFGARRSKLPLHIWMKWHGIAMDKRLSRVSLDYAQSSDLDIKNKREISIFSTSHQKFNIGAGGSVYLAPRLTYTWEPADYMDNMAVLKFFNENSFQGLSTDFTLNVEDISSKWFSYEEEMELTIQSRFTRGSYFLHLRYWDVQSGLNSTLSIPFEVR